LSGGHLCHQAHAGKLCQSCQILCCIEVTIHDQPTTVTVEDACRARELGFLHTTGRAELRRRLPAVSEPE
jgi:hypothetical protein